MHSSVPTRTEVCKGSDIPFSACISLLWPLASINPRQSKKSSICPRGQTVKALVDTLSKHRLVHARGPPGSGKTMLADLLVSYYRGFGGQVIVAAGWEEGIDPIHHLIHLGQQQGCHDIEHDSFDTSNVVVIFDEAQQTYKDLKLWLGPIKSQYERSSGPRLCLFSSYGSPTTGRIYYPPGVTPVYFTPEQRVSIANTSPFFAFYSTGVCRRCQASMLGSQPLSI